MKNELIHESSPYLLQHSHNPVHWQPWGKAALELAKKSGKPILVSIGYSACHWCHVMERESFEDEATAAVMNDLFINIKIDREERPDIDHIYMDAVQAMTGSGGWPLNVFLTPDGKPFYGGTYFPPIKAFNRASWTDVLHSVHDAWTNRRSEMEQQAETLTEHIRNSNKFGRIDSKVDIPVGDAAFTKEDCRHITDNLMAQADKADGGFGKAPKFPQTHSINCLLQAAYLLKDENALAQAELSLIKMLQGGIYDQLGGGLCRYSTDNEWLAPHFEKMLYDNALFLITLSNAAQLTKKNLYCNAIKHICDYIFLEMKSKEGGYYAAIDADSEGEEGKFYVWDKTETDRLLGEDAALFNAYYDVKEGGNWEGKSILRILRSMEEVAEELNIKKENAATRISHSKEILMKARSKRVRPGTDDKILFGWNALLITAFCKAYAVMQDKKYLEAATELYAFIEIKFADDNGKYFHTYKDGAAKYPAFLEDYAFYAEACIHLQEITADEKYLYKAKDILHIVMDKFPDTESEYFFFTAKDQDDVVVRKIELYDGATPSPNSVMAKNLLYLSIVFENNKWHEKAIAMIFSLKDIITKYPGSFGIWTGAAMNIAAGINEITIIGTDMMPLLHELLLSYLPNKIVQASYGSSDMPLLREKAVSDKTFIYLCRNYECKEPVDSTGKLFQALYVQLF